MTGPNFPPPDSGIRSNDDVGKINEIGKGPQKGLLMGQLPEKVVEAFGLDAFGNASGSKPSAKEYEGFVAEGIGNDEVATVHTSAGRTLSALGIDPPPGLADRAKLYRVTVGLSETGQIDLTLVAHEQELDGAAKGKGPELAASAAKVSKRLGFDLSTSDGRVKLQIQIGAVPTGKWDVQTVERYRTYITNDRPLEIARTDRALVLRRDKLVADRAEAKDPYQKQQIDGEIAQIDQKRKELAEERQFVLGEAKQFLTPDEYKQLLGKMEAIEKGKEDGADEPKDTVEIKPGTGKQGENPVPPSDETKPEAHKGPEKTEKSKEKDKDKFLDNASVLRFLAQLDEAERKQFADMLDLKGKKAFERMLSDLDQILKDPSKVNSCINRMANARVSADGTVTVDPGISFKATFKSKA